MNKNKAINKVNELIEGLDIEYPVDLRKICDTFEIRVYKKNIKKDGYYFCRDGKKYIFIKTGYSSNRERFILAHELGHYFLHSDEVLQICDGIREIFDGKSLIIDSENEANMFASELLLPTLRISDLLPKRSLTINKLEEIAEQYEVSLSVATIKCIQNSKSESETAI